MQEIDKPAAVEQLQLKKNRRVILAIFGIPAVVILLSSILYFLVETRAVDLGTVNNGELITPPLEYSSLPFERVSGENFDFNQQDPKWAFVVIGDSQCINDCERMLYIARQTIIALAKKMGQVRLQYITTDGFISKGLQQHFEEEFVGIDQLKLDQSTLQDFFAASAIESPLAGRQFFVVDPMGWLMMRYQVEDTAQDTLNTLGKAVVKDMKRLIK